MHNYPTRHQPTRDVQLRQPLELGPHERAVLRPDGVLVRVAHVVRHIDVHMRHAIGKRLITECIRTGARVQALNTEHRCVSALSQNKWSVTGHVRSVT